MFNGAIADRPGHLHAQTSPNMSISYLGGFTSVDYVFRGDPNDGYWIPKEWLFDDAEKDHQIDSLKGQIKAKQKIIADQAEQIRECIGMLHKEMPLHGTSLRRRVEAAIKRIHTLKSENTEKGRARIGDSERMGAEMTARRNFLARVFHAIWPGRVLWDGDPVDGVEDEILSWIGGASVRSRELDNARGEIENTLAELKSTGHKHEGRSLSDLVDIAIDTERERHHDTLTRISKALNQEWTARASAMHPYRNWCSHLVNVIKGFWIERADVGRVGVPQGVIGTPRPNESSGAATMAGDAEREEETLGFNRQSFHRLADRVTRLERTVAGKALISR